MAAPRRIDYRAIDARLGSGTQRPTGGSAAAQAGLLVIYVLGLALLFVPGPQRAVLGDVAALVPVEVYFFGCLGALVYVFSTLRTLVAADGVADDRDDERAERRADDRVGLPWLPASARVSTQTLNVFSYLAFYLITGTLLAAGSYLVFAAFYGDLGAAATDPEAFPLALAFLTGLFIDPILRALERTVARVAGDVEPETRSLIVAATEAELYRAELADLRERREGASTR
jgi:hypothetical protein